MGPIDYEKAKEVTQELEENLIEKIGVDPELDRRMVLGGIGVAGAAGLAGLSSAHKDKKDKEEGEDHSNTHGKFGAVGEYESSDFDPHKFLRDFKTGEESKDHEVYKERIDGEEKTVRHFKFDARDVPVEVAPGVDFLSWAYNGQVPGPTIRAVEGEVIRVSFKNRGRHAHTIHPHLKNVNPAMDGIPQTGPGVIETDEKFEYNGKDYYEWKAQPAGVHFYHCHSLPLKEHIHRGLYGTIVVDPDPERVKENPREYVNYQGPITQDYRRKLVERAKERNHTYPENDRYDEMVMVMNGFDTNFDGGNEIYAANTRAFAYGVGSSDGKGNWKEGETKKPIEINKNEKQRVYLVNTIEFDLINSFHTHSQFFDYYDHGTTLFPTHKTIDTVMQCQAQRGIIELDYSEHQPGLYMFHAHQSEFAELGWMSFFEVKDR